MRLVSLGLLSYCCFVYMLLKKEFFIYIHILRGIVKLV